MYIVTSEYNEYDQYGEYYVSWFSKKPTLEQLIKLFDGDAKLAKHVLSGGGRRGAEEVWHNLIQPKEGEKY